VRIAFVAVLAGCSFAVPATNGTDAAGSGEGNAAVCDPSAADTCKDPQTLTACRADGTGFDDRACSLGCIATPAAHCVGIVPSNGIPVATLTDGDADLDTTGVGVLDVNTDTGAIAGVRAAGPGYDGASHIYFATVVQASAPTIGVFAFGSLHVAAGTTVRAHGGNALALVAEGTIEIDGIVDVTGGATACTSGVTDLAQCAGPGGMTGGGPQASASGAGAGTFGTVYVRRIPVASV